MKKIWKILLFVFFVTLFFEIKNGFKIPVAEQAGQIQEFEEVALVRVVDGDTIEVKQKSDQNITVRLIGVDAPESVHLDETKNCEEGVVSSDYLKKYLEEKCENNRLYLEYDREKVDKYNRILAYVYIDKDTMLQEELLSNGMVKCMFVGENVKYQSCFTELENKAKEGKVGLWKQPQ